MSITFLHNFIRYNYNLWSECSEIAEWVFTSILVLLRFSTSVLVSFLFFIFVFLHSTKCNWYIVKSFKFVIQSKSIIIGTTPRAKKSQKVKAGSAKRKSTRKSKSTPAKSKSTPSPAPAPKKETETSNMAEVPKDEAPKKAEVVAPEVIIKPVKVKTEVPEQKEEIAAVEIPVETKPVVKTEPKVVEKIIKKEKLPVPVPISTDVEMKKVDDPPKQIKTVTTKTVKKVKKASSKKESKKETPSTKLAAEDKTKKDENATSKDETVKLNEKIKALEKKVTTQNQTPPSTEKTTTAETKEVAKKDIKKSSTKTASDRKRKSITTTGKDVKSKKSTKPKVKVEKLDVSLYIYTL